MSWNQLPLRIWQIEPQHAISKAFILQDTSYLYALSSVKSHIILGGESSSKPRPATMMRKNNYKIEAILFQFSKFSMYTVYKSNFINSMNW